MCVACSCSTGWRTGATAPHLPLWRVAEQQVLDSVAGNVADHPRIGPWREACRRFGAKPSEHRRSTEAMVRRVVQPGEMPSINPLVNIANILSLCHLLPTGVHSLGLEHEALELRAALPQDMFTPADSKPVESPPAGEIVFATGHTVMTRRWTWRQAQGTQTLADTTQVFFSIDGLPPCSEDEVMAAMRDVTDWVKAQCGGVAVQSAVLSAARPQLRRASRGAIRPAQTARVRPRDAMPHRHGYVRPVAASAQCRPVLAAGGSCAAGRHRSASPRRWPG